uniref:Uncharacterized protein n=1 Tax=Timema poppense TaxID=170557 RepID=A0A7R9DBR9_TIMPO|nr:unnamed protein product [Timema poppensis]
MTHPDTEQSAHKAGRLVVLRVSHSSLKSSDKMKPRSGDWAVTIDFLKEASNTSLSSGSNVNEDYSI